MYKLLLSAGLALAVVSLQAQTPAGSYSQSNTTSQSNTSSSNNYSQNNNPQFVNNQKAQISYDVNRLLRDTQDARRAIESQNTQEAQQDVTRALRVSTRLNSVSGGREFVPVYTELYQYSELAPGQRSPQNIVVAGANEDYTRVVLDTRMARMHLEAAMEALDSGHLNVANEALAAVQNGVIKETVEADKPLLRARENLALAQAAVNNNNYPEARTALQAASTCLAQYEQQGGANSAATARLISQINNFSQGINQNHANAGTRIESFWSRTVDLGTPDMAVASLSPNCNNAMMRRRNGVSPSSYLSQK